MSHFPETPRKIWETFKGLSSCNYDVETQSCQFLGTDNYVVTFEFAGY